MYWFEMIMCSLLVAMVVSLYALMHCQFKSMVEQDEEE